MHKAGGILILMAGILAGVATVAAILFGLFVAPQAGEHIDTIGIFIGGTFTTFLMLILGVIALNTPRKWPAWAALALSILQIVFNLGGGLVTLTMLFAFVGAILALVNRQQRTVSG